MIDSLIHLQTDALFTFVDMNIGDNNVSRDNIGGEYNVVLVSFSIITLAAEYLSLYFCYGHNILLLMKTVMGSYFKKLRLDELPSPSHGAAAWWGCDVGFCVCVVRVESVDQITVVASTRVLRYCIWDTRQTTYIYPNSQTCSFVCVPF